MNWRKGKENEKRVGKGRKEGRKEGRKGWASGERNRNDGVELITKLWFQKNNINTTNSNNNTNGIIHNHNHNGTNDLGSSLAMTNN